MSVTVPETLFLTLQASFQAEAKRICADMAKLLGIPEKELCKKVLNGKKLNLTLVEDTERPLTCLVFQHTGATLARCRRPCVLGTSRCTFHQDAAITEPPANTKALVRLQTVVHDGSPLVLWCDEETGAVYDAKHTHVGTYENERLVLKKNQT
jgi:hypothetical protein